MPLIVENDMSLLYACSIEYDFKFLFFVIIDFFALPIISTRLAINAHHWRQLSILNDGTSTSKWRMAMVDDFNATNLLYQPPFA